MEILCVCVCAVCEISRVLTTASVFQFLTSSQDEQRATPLSRVPIRVMRWLAEHLGKEERKNKLQYFFWVRSEA